MINLKYKLTKNDAVNYYEMISSNADETRTARLFAIIWFPALLTALLIVLKLYKSVLWIMVSIFLSFVWSMLFAPKMFRDVARTAANRRLNNDKFEFKDIELELNESTLTVNGENKIIKKFVTYYDLVILMLDDGSNLIIPERAFKSQQDMEDFFTHLIRTVNTV